MKFLKHSAVALLLVALAGCSGGANSTTAISSSDDKVVKRAGRPDIHIVKNDAAAAMSAAIVKARATIGDFITAFKAPKAGQKNFTLKKQFIDANGGEHMWVSELSFDGKSFRGVLTNAPYEVRNVKAGDLVTVTPQEISDWMYIDNGKLVGGTTIRALTDKMSPAERRATEQEGGFKLN